MALERTEGLRDNQSPKILKEMGRLRWRGFQVQGKAQMELASNLPPASALAIGQETPSGPHRTAPSPPASAAELDSAVSPVTVSEGKKRRQMRTKIRIISAALTRQSHSFSVCLRREVTVHSSVTKPFSMHLPGHLARPASV